MAKKLTCASFVVFPDGRTVPVSALSDAERETWHRGMLDRLSERMSDYYTQHPDEFARLGR